MKAKLTKGNVDNRSIVSQMAANMRGFLFADKSYISKDLFLRLMARGLKIITGIKCSMKNILMSFEEKNPSVKTLSRRDGFRLSKKQIHA